MTIKLKCYKFITTYVVLHKKDVGFNSFKALKQVIITNNANKIKNVLFLK